MSEKRDQLDELSNRLIFRLYQSANVLHKSGSARLADLGVTTQQWSVLAALSRPKVSEGMSVNELCQYLMVTRQNLSPMLSRLEASGYLSKARDTVDQRARRIILTEQGWALLREIEARMEVFYGDVFEGVSRDDQISCIHYLNRLIKNMSID